MTKDSLIGLVILMKSDKSLVQTKRVRIFQREILADKVHFLIPLTYEGSDLQPYTVMVQYLDSGGTVHAEVLNRLSDGQGGYEDYYDKDGNATHMIYVLDVTSKLTRFSGDYSVKLSLSYTDYDGQTSSDSDDESAPEPEPVYHLINTEDTIITVLPIADYYSVVPDESLSVINTKLAELDAKQKELEATAEVYDATKADGIEMYVDQYRQCLRLTSNGKPVGNEIDLSALGDEISEWSQNGLVKVITEDEPEPGPTPSDEYANDIVLVINEQTQAIYLTHNGHMVGTPLSLNDLGEALADWNEEGLVKVITDDNSVITDENS